MSSDPRPVFQQVLGAQWHLLGEAVRRHYTMAPHSNDHVRVVGTMHEVHHARWAAPLVALGRLFGALVPATAGPVPIEVDYRCRPDTPHLYWDRVFHFAGREPVHFRSHMAHDPADGAVVTEYVRFGIGMRLAVSAEHGALVFRQRGYVWQLGRWRVPLPLGLLMGTAQVEERPDPHDRDAFSMRLVLRHRWFGDVFRYSGSFRLPDDLPCDR